ncbi:protein vreteno-like isoform X1 [Chironomus tepperi]|uniref:protein vreteno-like isoform X1 n=1 Tax=Chironomus tepperi TaxID=113505 RepID=UPI00391F9A89
MNRLFLKNVPISMTKEQIKSIFFPDLENLEINFPKRIDNDNIRNVFVQLNSKNEAILCLKFINHLEYHNVEASFAEIDLKKSLCTIIKEDVKSCAFCGDINSEFICNGCSTMYFATFYCCKDHQERDWKRHKNECKSLPALKRIDDIFGSIEIENHTNRNFPTENEPSIKKGKYFIKVMDIKVNCKVVITSVINTRLLYIRPLCLESNDLFNVISHYSNSAPALSEKPSVDEYVLVPYNNSYHRAKILDLFESDQNGFNTRVVLTDFGNELKLKWQDMKHLSYKIRGKPSYTQKVILNDVPSEKYYSSIDNYLQKLSFDEEVLEIVNIFGNQINGLKVILKISQTGAIVNEVVKNMLTDDHGKYFYDVIKIPKFSTRSSIKIFVSDSTQLENQKLLSCFPYEKLSDYLLMLDEFKKYCKRISNETYFPLLNEMCIVKYNEQWHRASCSDSNSNTEFIKCTLIDLMINVQVKKTDIRKIPQSFTQHFYTSLCYVEGINEGNVAKIKEIIKKEKIIHACVQYDSETKCPVLNNLYY